MKLSFPVILIGIIVLLITLTGCENDASVTQSTSTSAPPIVEATDPGTSPTPAPTSSAVEVEPYVVKGYLLNGQGNPIPDVIINADNLLLYDSNMQEVRDENGFYRIELTHGAATWRMNTRFNIEYNGKQLDIWLPA